MARQPPRVYSGLTLVTTSAAARPTSTSSRCRFGLFEFDPRAGELTREGRSVKLSPQPARVLALLVARPGEVVLRDELREHLWGHDTFVDFERGLNFCVLQVRTALGDSSENPRFVQTVPKRGYRFIAPVVPIEAAAPTAPAIDSTPIATAAGDVHGSGVTLPARAVPDAPLLRRWPGYAAFATALLFTALAIVWLAQPRPTAPVTTPVDRIRIAVLPIEPIAGDQATQVLADGLTDELISQLGQLDPRRLAVIARTSAMSYRGSRKNVAEIGRELNVSLVIESSLRRDGTTLRIGSKLIPVADQTPSASWEETFDSAANAGATASTRAAIRLARLVGAAIMPEPPPEATARATTSAAAWDQFMRGRALVNGGTAADVRQAIQAFEAAVASDPALAPAWAKLAEAHHLLVMMGVAAPLDAYPAAKIAAARAIGADASVSDAHVANGLVALWFDWDPRAAAAAFERALALNASNAAAHHDYGWALVALGRDDQAIAEITTARDLDPLSARANSDIGWLYLQLRRPIDAQRACEQTLAVDATALEPQACLERAYTQRGLWDAALTAARLTSPPDAWPTIAPAGRAADAAMRALWQWRLERLEQAARTRWISPYTLAVQQVLVGNTSAALDALERAVADRAGMLVFLDRDPALDPLRGDPRFRAVSERRAQPAPAVARSR
jgi:DNA-binding winged helix-turn-helix (wHTH) protein/TolB-like protein/Tfp pilus assembly protein PilF